MNVIFLLCGICVYSNSKWISALNFFDKLEKKCYDVYGCFPTEHSYSLTPLIKAQAPWSPEDLQVTLILSTKKHDKTIINDLLPNRKHIPYLELNKPIKIIVPGFLHGSGKIIWTKKLRNVLLSNEDCNVMVVAWKEPIIKIDYVLAMANIRMVGAVVGEFLCQLRTFHNYSLDMVHIYGHSLGAHAAGFIGKYCKKKIGKTVIGTITGLDPAGPGFEGKPEQARLDFKDAKFVLAVHTDAGELLNAHLGIIQNVGDVDVFPNGGEIQPGCPKTSPRLAFQMRTSAPEFTEWYNQAFGCHHIRATDYAIEWLNSTDCPWIAHWCNSWENYSKGMCRQHGKNNSLTVTLGLDYHGKYGKKAGKYYIETKSKKPFCKPDSH